MNKKILIETEFKSDRGNLLAKITNEGKIYIPADIYTTEEVGELYQALKQILENE